MNDPRAGRITHLLSSLGAQAAVAFEQAVSPLDLTRSEAGMLRLLGESPGISQRTASRELGVGPSRIVAVLDRLEDKGLIERRRSATDRRSHEVTLTAAGQRMLGVLRSVAATHEAQFTAGLDEAGREQLLDALEALASARETAPSDTHTAERAQR